MSTHRQSRAVVSIAITAVVALVAGRSAYAEPGSPPDIIPVSIMGPAIVHVDTQVTVHFSTANLGGPLLGSYTAQVVLGQGLTPAIDDAVVATLTTQIVSSHSVLVSIPKFLDAGSYHWFLRLVAVAGETNVGNNLLYGLSTNLIKIDLEIMDPAPIQVFVRPTDAFAEPAEVIVENVGTPGSLLIYKASSLAPSPWLTIESPENFAIAGNASTPNRFLVDHAGLNVGTYETTIRFESTQDAEDFEDVPFTLVVGDPKFVAGDRIQGQISEPGQQDEIVFDGLAGMKLHFWVMSNAGDLKPLFTIFDPAGKIVDTMKFPHSNKNTKKTLKLKMSGEHRLVISGSKEKQVGNYRIKTHRKMPKKSKAHTTTVKAGEVADVLALGGAMLDISCEGEATSLTLSHPDGLLFDMTGFSQTTAGITGIKGISLSDTGKYGVVIGGLGAAGATLHLTPVQPKQGEAKIYLP